MFILHRDPRTSVGCGQKLQRMVEVVCLLDYTSLLQGSCRDKQLDYKSTGIFSTARLAPQDSLNKLVKADLTSMRHEGVGEVVGTHISMSIGGLRRAQTVRACVRVCVCMIGAYNPY